MIYIAIHGCTGAACPVRQATHGSLPSPKSPAIHIYIYKRIYVYLFIYLIIYIFYIAIYGRTGSRGLTLRQATHGSLPRPNNPAVLIQNKYTYIDLFIYKYERAPVPHAQ